MFCISAVDPAHTYSDQDAVQVHLLASLLPLSSQDLGEAPGVVHAQDVDVILAAEGLDESEVDLQGDVLRVLVVGGQDAQHHVIRVSAKRQRRCYTHAAMFCAVS